MNDEKHAEEPAGLGPTEEPRKRKTFVGYFLPSTSVPLATWGIFAALTTVFTVLVTIPIPATSGFFNIGEVGVMLTGLLFGPIIGGLAGGTGSALADVLLGYSYYAPITLVVKGLEGFVVGLLSNPKSLGRGKLYPRQVVAVAAGGTVMVLGYFLAEVRMYGFPSAWFEAIYANLFQALVGAVVSLAVAAGARNAINRSFPEFVSKIYRTTDHK
ncbi:MAG: ECF transporter S component [Promethearchaeota archaeon]